MPLLLGLNVLARSAQDVCLHEPGLSCTSIRATNASGILMLGIGQYMRDVIDTTPMEGDSFGASASYQINARTGTTARLDPTDSASMAMAVPGLGPLSDSSQKYKVVCGGSDASFTNQRCTFSSPDIDDDAPLGNFPWPNHYGTGYHHEAPSSFFSESLSMLFVLFPLNASFELYRLPISSDMHGRTANDGLGRNYSLSEKADPMRRVTLTAFRAEHLGIKHDNWIHGLNPLPLVYDDLKVVGLPTHVDVTPTSHPECCNTLSTTVPNCADVNYFHYDAPCEGTENGCTGAGRRGLLPLPNLGSPTTLLDTRYSPPMIYTCRPDGAGGLKISESNLYNQSICTPLDGPTPAACKHNATKPSSRAFTIPADEILMEPLTQRTPAGFPAWAIVLIVLVGGLVLVVAVALPLWWLLQKVWKQHKYTAVY